jgi:hypothetical protein
MITFQQQAGDVGQGLGEAIDEVTLYIHAH